VFNHMSGGSSVRLVQQKRAGVEREREREREREGQWAEISS